MGWGGRVVVVEGRWGIPFILLFILLLTPSVPSSPSSGTGRKKRSPSQPDLMPGNHRLFFLYVHVLMLCCPSRSCGFKSRPENRQGETPPHQALQFVSEDCLVTHPLQLLLCRPHPRCYWPSDFPSSLIITRLFSPGWTVAASSLWLCARQTTVPPPSTDSREGMHLPYYNWG